MDSAVTAPVRLHIGCGAKRLSGWVNIDRVARAPGVATDVDPAALPYPDGSVEEVLAELKLACDPLQERAAGMRTAGSGSFRRLL